MGLAMTVYCKVLWLLVGGAASCTTKKGLHWVQAFLVGKRKYEGVAGTLHHFLDKLLI